MINNIRFCGGHGPGETPGPIPNPEAKPWHGDGTMLERAWESSTPPQQHVEGGSKDTILGASFFIPGWESHPPPRMRAGRRLHAPAADASCRMHAGESPCLHATVPSCSLHVRMHPRTLTAGVFCWVHAWDHLHALAADAFCSACASRFLRALLADALRSVCVSRLVRAQLADAFCALHVREFPRAPMAGAFCRVHAGERLCAPEAVAFCWLCMSGLPGLQSTAWFRSERARRFIHVHIAAPFCSLHADTPLVRTTAGSHFAGGDIKRSAGTVHAPAERRKIAILQKRIPSPLMVSYPRQQNL